MSGRASGIVFEQECPLIEPAATEDLSKYPHVITDTNITWEKVGKIYVAKYEPTRDSKITVPHNESITFTNHGFSGLMWVYLTALNDNDRFMIKGAFEVRGWAWFYYGTYMIIETYQAAARQTSRTDANIVTLNEWQLIGFTRNGASARLYRNGVDVTTTVGVHINPVYATDDLIIGNVDITNRGLTGYESRARIIRYPLDASDIKGIFDSERTLFGI